MKWIAIYCSREWTHAWIVEAATEQDAEKVAHAQIREAFCKGEFGTPDVDQNVGEWLEIRPMALSFVETCKA